MIVCACVRARILIDLLHLNIKSELAYEQIN